MDNHETNPIFLPTNINISQEVSPPSVRSKPLESQAVLCPIPTVLRSSSLQSGLGLLDDFFCWRRQPLVKDPNHTPSKSTRPPSFHDMHLHEGLRLKKVVVCKELPKLISSICDRYYLDKCEDFVDGLFAEPRNLKKFPTKDYREKISVKSLQIRDEETLRTAYAQQLALMCSIVASTLNFRLKEWDAVFSWTPHSTVRQPNGKADGFLSIIPDKISLLEKTQLQEVLLMDKYLLNHYVIWEFKSLVAGSLSVMKGIAEHEGDFVWTTCTSPRDCEHHCTDGRISITGRKTGPDATRQLWSDNISKNSPKRGRKENDTNEFPSPKSNGLGEILSSSRSETDSGLNKEEVLSNLKSSHDIIQQVWFQAVKNDTTYVIINAGNSEYVGIRERETQTLFLSELLYPAKETEPTQVKLLTAILMAGYYDTLNRAKQLEKMAGSNRLPDLHTFNYDRDSHAYPESQPAPTERQKKEEINNNDKALISMLQSARSIYFHPPSQITICNAPLYKLDRKGSKADPSLDSEPTLYLNADTKLRGVLGERTRLVLMEGYKTSKTCSGKIVVKYAKSDDEKLALQKEYEMYDRLDDLKFSFIVQVYGLFTGHLDGTCYDFLFMENGGQSVFDRIEDASQPQTLARLFKKFGKSLENAKNELHHHGYVHGNLGRSHILVNTDTKKVSFVSLGKCRRIVCQVEEVGRPKKKARKLTRNGTQNASHLKQEVETLEERFKKDSEELDELLVKYCRPVTCDSLSTLDL